MAELLVRVRDREGHNVALCGEGHVIVACPDGWGWSVNELTNPDWRICRVPGMSDDDVSRYLVPQRVLTEWFDPARRAFYIDHTTWPTELQQWWTDDSRAQPIMQITMSLFESAKTAEPLYEKENVVGSPPIVG